MYLAPDVIDKIKVDFKESEREEAIRILETLNKELSNIGDMYQANRGLVFLSEGSLDKLKNYIFPPSDFEPRDIIIEAEEKAGNPGHWFSIPFDEMDNFSGELPEDEEYEDDGLPF